MIIGSGADQAGKWYSRNDNLANESEFFSLNDTAYHSVEKGIWTFNVTLKKELPLAQYWFPRARLGIKGGEQRLPKSTTIITYPMPQAWKLSQIYILTSLEALTTALTKSL